MHGVLRTIADYVASFHAEADSKLCLVAASGVTSLDGLDRIVLNELAPHQPSPHLRPYDDPLPLTVDERRLDLYKYVVASHGPSPHHAVIWHARVSMCHDIDGCLLRRPTRSMDEEEAANVVKNNKMRPHPQTVARIMGIHASSNAMPGGAVVGFGHLPSTSAASLLDEPSTDVKPLVEQAVLAIQRVLVVRTVQNKDADTKAVGSYKRSSSVAPTVSRMTGTVCRRYPDVHSVAWCGVAWPGLLQGRGGEECCRRLLFEVVAGETVVSCCRPWLSRRLCGGRLTSLWPWHFRGGVVLSWCLSRQA